jgi:uncharacterized membrane protein SpoIIM required for sporulation
MDSYFFEKIENINKDVKKTNLNQNLLEEKIDALTSMTRAIFILLLISFTFVLSTFLGGASVNSGNDKQHKMIIEKIEKLDSNLSK